MNEHEGLIEEAAKALTALTDAEWEIATAEGTDHLTGYFDAARRVLAVFEKAHIPTDDEREALAFVIEQGWGNPTWDGVTLRPIDRRIADAVFAAGFTRSEAPEPSAGDARPGFFPNVHCRHHQVADGWAKVWCIRTEDGHTEHEAEGGVVWTSDAPAEPQGAPSTPSLANSIERARVALRDAELVRHGRISPSPYRLMDVLVDLISYAEKQVEPSDAQVEVAWRVWLGLDPDEAVMGNWIHEARMKARAALRAAGGVR